MELDQALAELGLDPAGDHDQASIRRAYLKQVKQRKPETDPEGFRRLREAYDLLRGFGPMLPLLRGSAPPPLDMDDDGGPPADPPGPEPAPALPDPFAVASGHLQQDQPDLAVDVMVAALPNEHATGDWYPYHQALRFVLVLHKRDLVGPASRLFAAIKAGLGGTAPQVGAIGQQLGLLYLICSELNGMPDLPITFRQSVVRGVLEDNVGVMADTVRAYQRAYGARQTKQVYEQMVQRAPNLVSLFHWQHEATIARAVLLPRAAVFIAIMLAIAVFAWSRTLPPAPRSEPPSIPILDRSSFTAFCEGADARDVSLCPWVQLLDEALRKGQCPQARGYLDGLQREARGYAPRVRWEIAKLAVRVKRQCP